MNRDLSMEGGELAAISKSLTKFARLFESFLNDARVWQDAFGMGIEQGWKEYFEEVSPSFSLEMDKTNLVVLEHYIKTLVLLKEVRLKSLKAPDDPFASSSEADEFKEKAERKLKELLQRAKALKKRMTNSGDFFGDDHLEDIDDLFEGDSGSGGPRLLPESQTSEPKKEVINPALARTPAHITATVVEPRLREVPIQGATPIPTLERGQPTTHDFGQMGKVVDPAQLLETIKILKKTHEDKLDLRLRTSSGPLQLSLGYYNASNNGAALLDVETFVKNHRMAFTAVLGMASKVENPFTDEKVLALVKRIHGYLRNIYSNIQKVIGPAGSKLLPDTGGSIDGDIFLQLEANLALNSWETIEDVKVFRAIFDENVTIPFGKFVAESDNKNKYLQSIYTTLMSG